MYPASSEIRNAQAAAMSSGRPTRRIGGPLDVLIDRPAEQVATLGPAEHGGVDEGDVDDPPPVSGQHVGEHLAVASIGAGLSAAAGALARPYEREATGLGGWVETSPYDGIQAVLPMIIGRVEYHSPSTTLLWKEQGPAEALSYRCADGGYLQLWFGAKGAYEAFLEHMGDPPSERGYNAELMSGAMAERGARWAARFATRDRYWWPEGLAGRKFRCEPVWRPGEALRDPHVVQAGLSVTRRDPEHGTMTVLGQVVRVTSAGAGEPLPGLREASLLSGVRVLDLSAYLAGPVAPLVLAELGADVVKVEPLSGDVPRAIEPMFAAGQRSKRAMALDLKAPDAPAVLERLFRWSDVVHHNSRVGLAGRLGYDEATVRAVNPDVIYSFASGFGEHGPRTPLRERPAHAGAVRRRGGPGWCRPAAHIPGVGGDRRHRRLAGGIRDTRRPLRPAP
jgi:crotonobetainyl-CoA:carnitine CoA-transferase CaiB-like acyl-CoA transferase